MSKVMAKITRFEDLMSWQRARELNRLVYKISENGNFARDFGLRDQIRRASVSVMSNIAEGFERSVEVSRLIYGLMTYLQRSELRGAKFKQPGGAPK